VAAVNERHRTPAITSGEEETMTEANETAEPSGTSGGSLAWIPVTERLPANDLMSLVWSNSNGLHLAYLDSYRQWRDADHNPGKKITHWMPLPAPPTDGK
jgi:hypothetical protein